MKVLRNCVAVLSASRSLFLCSSIVIHRLASLMEHRDTALGRGGLHAIRVAPRG